MKLQLLSNRKWVYLFLAFAFPVIAFMILMIIGGYTPFGHYSMLYSDMYHQYFPFFKAFREALRSGDSLLYSWNVGMGMDYLGLISYYLASPLYLLSVFLPESWVLPYFSLLVPIKLGLASLFFAVFLKNVFRKDDLSLPLFGCFYGLCAWALGYQWNIMWLDSFALLPLVALGTVSLLRDKKFILYTVSLFLAIFANYYIGFFVCIFVLFLFICYQICRCRSIKRFFLDLCRIALFSALAIGMTAILELPALAALQNTQSSVNTFPEGFSVNIVSGEAVTAAREAWSVYKAAKASGEGDLFGMFWDAVGASVPPLLDGMKQIAGNLAGGLEPTFKEGLPNLYCGVGSLILAFLFLTAKGIKLRDKLCSVCLLVFFMLSFIIRQLDYIWHGFHFTNMIPYRFSFLFSFVMVYMAYRAFLLRKHFRIWQIVVAGVLSVCIMLLSESKNEPVFIAYNTVFLALYLGAFLFHRIACHMPMAENMEQMKEYCRTRAFRRKVSGYALAGVMALELVLTVVNFGVRFPYTDIRNYPNGTANTASMIRYMKEDDDLFYRAEVTHTQTLNDGALNSYNGISTFTSSANVKVTEFMRVLGYGARNTYNRYCFEESSPVANLFLNLKYMLERDGRVEMNSYFDEVHHFGNVYLLENNAYLPLGFLAESGLSELEFSSASNAFMFQNRLFSAATGLSEDVWTITPASWLSIQPNGTVLTSQSNTGYCYYKNESSQTTLTYTYNVTQSGFMCFDLNMSARNTFTVSKNSAELYRETMSLPQTIAVSDVHPGDVITVSITCKAYESGSITVNAGLVNDEVFRKGYDILAASTLQLTEFSNTNVEGTINCNRDGLLYTSIPQNGTNWSVLVDGEPAETVLIGDVMVGVMLTEGAHTVTFRYDNAAFSLGWKISLLCLVAFCVIAYVVYRPNLLPRKGKYEKVANSPLSRLSRQNMQKIDHENEK